ncbi:MAG: hypothetical protein IGQ88_01525, partial [Gloeomargaritaceae cyanobacterium C42_A2020_066]|nr:hypothetical protein [Gloeomargaritaceae cyanobacterium C42_A2020_066]
MTMILWSVHRRPTCTLTRWPGGFRLELPDGTTLAGRPAELATLKTRVLTYLQEPTPATPSSPESPTSSVPADNALVVARPAGAHTLDLSLATAAGTCALSLRELYDLATLLEQTQPIASPPVWQQAAGWGALAVALSLALGLYHWLQPALVVQRPNPTLVVPPRPAAAPLAKTPPTPADEPPPPPVTGIGSLPPPPSPGQWPVAPLVVPQSLPPPPPIPEA